MKNNKNWDKWAKYAVIALLALPLTLGIVIPASEIILGHVSNFLFDYIEKHLVGVFIVACIAGFIVWCTYQKPTQEQPKLVRDPKPTMIDYKTIGKTLFAVVKNIGESFGLAAIRGYSDLYVDEADRILSWENVWGMKYKLRKKLHTTNFDVQLATEAFQAEIDSVLKNYNPSKLAKINYPYGGTLKSVIQVAEIEDGNAYVYVYLVFVTSDTYFVQKANEERNDVAEVESNTDDADF